jgi:hypothetical protein
MRKVVNQNALGHAAELAGPLPAGTVFSTRRATGIVAAIAIRGIRYECSVTWERHI